MVAEARLQSWSHRWVARHAAHELDERFRSRYRSLNRWWHCPGKRVAYGKSTGLVPVMFEAIPLQKILFNPETWFELPPSGFGIHFLKMSCHQDPYNSLLKGYSWHQSPTVEKLLNCSTKESPLYPERPLERRLSTTLSYGFAINTKFDAPLLQRRTSQWSRSFLRSCWNWKIQLAAKGLPFDHGTTVLNNGALMTYDRYPTVQILISLVLSQWKFKNGINVHFEEDLHSFRPQSGQLATAQTSVTFWRKQEYHCCDSTTGPRSHTLRCNLKLWSQQGFWLTCKEKVESKSTVTDVLQSLPKKEWRHLRR